MTDLIQTRLVKSRKSHASKTGMDTRAAKALASGMFGRGPTFHEDEDGNMVREWTGDDWRRWTSDDLRSVLLNRVAVQHNELLGTVPPAAISYALNKGWLIAHGTTGLYLITKRCALELPLPLRFKGVNGGRKIPFVEPPARRA